MTNQPRKDAPESPKKRKPSSGRRVSLDLREQWWNLLDLWEASRKLRGLTYGVAGVILAAVALRLWVYPWWKQRTVFNEARQWMLAGKPGYAAEAVREAIALAPDKPETWRLAGDLARLSGRKNMEVDFARHAAELQPELMELNLEWASAALRADMPDEAARALEKIPKEALEKSSYGLRLRGDLARRNGLFTAAMNDFEAALRFDGPVAVDEVPLGIILIKSTDPKLRKRGFQLLEKWAPDPSWGMTALRALLADALARDDPADILKWAEKLQAHPGRIPADTPNLLRAYSRADEARLTEMLVRMEKEGASNPEAAAALIGWLNQVGRSAEAIRWMKTLPPANLRKPPLVVVAAEALRQAGDWEGLREFVKNGEWSGGVDFLGWLYGGEAARALGKTKEAEALGQNLSSRARSNATHALFAGSTLYGWGREKEAEALWWSAAAQTGRPAVEALGSLARFYQVRRDAEGQYRVFDRLHLLHPEDADVANNYAFFAALTGHQQLRAEQAAKAIHEKEPGNPTYRETYAFTLLVRNKAHEALALLQPISAEAAQSKPLAFVYGLVLAATGQKEAGVKLLTSIDPDILTTREVEMIKSVSGN